MSNQQSLMRPLRSDSLRPRPPAQAAAPAAQPVPQYEAPELPVILPSAPEPQPEPLPAPEPPAIIPDPPQELQTPPETVDFSEAELLPEESDPAEAAEELPADDASVSDEETDPVLSSMEEAQADPQPESALSDLIASILSEDDDEDDEDLPLLHDAVPDRYMPDPVCVPLSEEPAEKPRKSRCWLWPVLLILLAGGLYAAWRMGYVIINLP